MRVKFAVLFMLVFMLLTMPVAAQRVCNPFTLTPDAGMLPLGTVVEFEHWEGGTSPVLRIGTVQAYYILSCWPGAAVFGLEPQAYVVEYASNDGSQIVLNRGALNTD